MPRLGDDDDGGDEMQPLHRRRQAVAYPGGGIDSQPSKRILYGVVLSICLIWIIPNFFFRVRVCAYLHLGFLKRDKLFFFFFFSPRESSE